MKKKSAANESNKNRMEIHSYNHIPSLISQA